MSSLTRKVVGGCIAACSGVSILLFSYRKKVESDIVEHATRYLEEKLSTKDDRERTANVRIRGVPLMLNVDDSNREKKYASLSSSDHDCRIAWVLDLQDTSATSFFVPPSHALVDMRTEDTDLASVLGATFFGRSKTSFIWSFASFLGEKHYVEQSLENLSTPPTLVLSLAGGDEALRDVRKVEADREAIEWMRSLARRNLANIIVLNPSVTCIFEAATKKSNLSRSGSENTDDIKEIVFVVASKQPLLENSSCTYPLSLSPLPSGIIDHTFDYFLRLGDDREHLDRLATGMMISLLRTIGSDTGIIGGLSKDCPKGCVHLSQALASGDFDYLAKEWYALAFAATLARSSSETRDSTGDGSDFRSERCMAEVSMLRKRMLEVLLRQGRIELVPRIRRHQSSWHLVDPIEVNDENGDGVAYDDGNATPTHNSVAILRLPLDAFDGIFATVEDGLDRNNDLLSQFWLCASSSSRAAEYEEVTLRDYHEAVDRAFLHIDRAGLVAERGQLETEKARIVEMTLRGILDDKKRTLAEIEIDRLERSLCMREKEAESRESRIDRHYEAKGGVGSAAGS